MNQYQQPQVIGARVFPRAACHNYKYCILKMGISCVSILNSLLLIQSIAWQLNRFDKTNAAIHSMKMTISTAEVTDSYDKYD